MVRGTVTFERSSRRDATAASVTAPPSSRQTRKLQPINGFWVSAPFRPPREGLKLPPLRRLLLRSDQHGRRARRPHQSKSSLVGVEFMLKPALIIRAAAKARQAALLVAATVLAVVSLGMSPGTPSICGDVASVPSGSGPPLLRPAADSGHACALKIVSTATQGSTVVTTLECQCPSGGGNGGCRAQEVRTSLDGGATIASRSMQCVGATSCETGTCDWEATTAPPGQGGSWATYKCKA